MVRETNNAPWHDSRYQKSFNSSLYLVGKVFDAINVEGLLFTSYEVKLIPLENYWSG